MRQHELLLRMLDERGEVIPPAAFIGVAERFDLMQEIDRWVVARAIRLMGEQKARRARAASSRSTSRAARRAIPSC